jgi:acetyltransferase-like isoleucine patch superfamily enzyme
MADRNLEATHARRVIARDPEFEYGLAQFLRDRYAPEALVAMFGRHSADDDAFAAMMRRAVFRAVAKRTGDGISIGTAVGFRHLETFEIGSGVFVGAQAYLQGRHDGSFVVGDGCWIGPQCYFDARDLIIGAHVGFGPGVRILGSEHTGVPADVPIIRTDLRIRPVRIEDDADIGTGAIILPGVTIGKGSIVGAGAVVRDDVLPYSVVAGVPARPVRERR